MKNPTNNIETRESMFAKLWQSVVGDKISTREFKRLTGRTVTIGGQRNCSKWTFAQLRQMRAERGHGRPPGLSCPKKDAQMNAMHDAWYAKKFGAVA